MTAPAPGPVRSAVVVHLAGCVADLLQWVHDPEGDSPDGEQRHQKRGGDHRYQQRSDQSFASLTCSPPRGHLLDGRLSRVQALDIHRVERHEHLFQPGIEALRERLERLPRCSTPREMP